MIVQNFFRSFSALCRICLFLLATAASVSAQITSDPGETQVTIHRPSSLEILGATEICEGSETALKVEGDFESFSWSNGEIGRTIKVQKPGVYEVTVKTKGGCTLTASVNVTTKPCT